MRTCNGAPSLRVNWCSRTVSCLPDWSPRDDGVAWLFPQAPRIAGRSAEVIENRILGECPRRRLVEDARGCSTVDGREKL